MARSGRSKSQSFPHGRRRKLDNGKRVAPRAVRRETGKRFMEQCTEKEVDRISGIPMEEQTESSTTW